MIVDGRLCQSRASSAGVYRGNSSRASKPHWLVLLLDVAKLRICKPMSLGFQPS